ncbi:MAG: ABC transporter ATP-binding protein [Stappiaceae bacterium]
MARKAIGPIRRTFVPWEDTSAKPFVEFRNVTKRFGEFVAVDNLSLSIYEREFFALLGPSGCGKTTLMRMLAGFENPTEGEILLDGEPITGLPPYMRPVNMMFQSYALFPHLSVEKNIAFGLRQDKVPKAEIKQRVGEMLELVKLQDFARRKPHQLSGGQRQRVALARSLAKRPKVLLLDEPLGALDRKLREETQFELMSLQEEIKTTFLIVTHDQEEAMIVADRIAVMDHGKLMQVATPPEIYEQPASRYIADFIGDINLIEGRVESKTEETSILVHGNNLFRIDLEEPTPVDEGEQAWFTVRPEKVRIAIDAPEEARANAVQGVIWDIAYMGDVTIYHVRISDQLSIRATVANTKRKMEQMMTWDDEVWVSWDRDAGIILAE